MTTRYDHPTTCDCSQCVTARLEEWRAYQTPCVICNEVNEPMWKSLNWIGKFVCNKCRKENHVSSLARRVM